jgi:hypothetical protein
MKSYIMNPNVRFRDLLADFERLVNSPKPEPKKITVFISKPAQGQPLIKGRSITSRKRKAALEMKRAGGAQPKPAPKKKDSIMLLFKRREPLAKSVPVAPPNFVWTGRSGKVNLPAGVVIEDWS